MKLSYIILNDSGERFDLSQANEFNPNEYAWIDPNGFLPTIALSWDAENLDGFCYMQDPNDDPNDPAIGVTIAFSSYDANGCLLYSDEGGVTFWL